MYNTKGESFVGNVHECRGTDNLFVDCMLGESELVAEDMGKPDRNANLSTCANSYPHPRQGYPQTEIYWDGS